MDFSANELRKEKSGLPFRGKSSYTDLRDFSVKVKYSMGKVVEGSKKERVEFLQK